jgi:hypothetical protein
MTSTLINDNVTTSATFNFTDDYLKETLQDVSALLPQDSGAELLRRLLFEDSQAHVLRRRRAAEWLVCLAAG